MASEKDIVFGQWRLREQVLKEKAVKWSTLEKEMDKRCDQLQEERDVMQAEMNRVAQMHEDLEQRNVCCEVYEKQLHVHLYRLS